MSEQYIVVMEPSNYAPEALSVYRALGRLICMDEEQEQQIDAYLNEATVLVVRFGSYLNPDFLRATPKLRYIVSPTTGLNHIDLDYCTERNIEVLSLKGEKEFLRTITATPEHTMGLMLALVRGITGAHLSVINERKWDRNRFCGSDLSDLRLGILGFGRVGQKVAHYAKAFGMNICGHDPYVPGEHFKAGGVRQVQPEELYASSDIVSVHVDYQPGREQMIGAEQFNQMKTGSYFINTSRGELVDEFALTGALRTGRLAGAAVDVLQNEYDHRVLFKSPLIEYAGDNDNLIITPHIGGCTSGSMRKTECFMAEKLRRKIRENSG